MSGAISRRQIMTGAAAVAGAAAVSAALPAAAEAKPGRGRRKPRVAVIITEYRPNSHGDVITTKLLEGYQLRGVDTEPRIEVASIYLDQRPANDVGVYMARKHNVPIFDTIPEALAVGRTGKVDVDGVILIGEHGAYPTNQYGQVTYPRRRFFDSATAAMIASNRFVPMFNDKHLSQSYVDAKHMLDTTRRYRIPMFAGSTLPLGWRFPALTYQRGANLTEAVAVGYSGIESYGFHVLETLQCMVERRAGGETGVAAVQTVRGQAVWDAAAAGRWDESLMHAALDSIRAKSGLIKPGDIKANVKDPIAFFIEYVDGFKATALLLNGGIETLAYAGKRDGQTEAAEFLLELGWPYGHFTFLDRQIEAMVHSGVAPYPLERTVLTTGILDAAMLSNYNNGARRLTPELSTLRYEAVEEPKGTLEPSGTGIGDELPPPSPDTRPYPR
ncbi:hypothetical protein [Asanoa sp. NPDC050611]|uniref:hypothetical protein n=1 Tax=Asanoa sp. NPDC050611 TaxID=3157098 RepID=UPI0033E99827